MLVVVKRIGEKVDLIEDTFAELYHTLERLDIDHLHEIMKRVNLIVKEINENFKNAEKNMNESKIDITKSHEEFLKLMNSKDGEHAKEFIEVVGNIER